MSLENSVPRTFIIIVTYNGMNWLKKCLASCENYRVVVIDNNSSDNTVEYIREYFPEVKLFPQSRNLGFGQANNIGIGYALKKEADYVYLLNQDAYLEKDCLRNLLAVHQRYPQYGILSPIHTNAEKNRLDKNFSNFMGYKNNNEFYSDFVLDNPIKEIYEVPFVNAAGWLISKKCLKTIGGFDPIFFHYGEDDNYCQRVRYHGFKIGVATSSFMVHDREERTENLVHRKTQKYYANLEKKLKIHYADINFSRVEDFDKVIKSTKKNILRQSFLLKFQNANHHRHILKKYKRILQEIKDSIEKNKIGGPIYF